MTEALFLNLLARRNLREQLTSLGYTPMTRREVFAKKWRSVPFFGHLLSYIPDCFFLGVYAAALLASITGASVFFVVILASVFATLNDYEAALAQLSLLWSSAAMAGGILALFLSSRAHEKKVVWCKMPYFVFLASSYQSPPAPVREMAEKIEEKIPDARVFVEYAYEDPFLVVIRGGERVYVAHWVC